MVATDSCLARIGLDTSKCYARQMLVGATKPLGDCVDFSIAPSSRTEYIKRYSPKEIATSSLHRVFKKDIVLDGVVERIRGADVLYIETTDGRGDELYYFKSGSLFFHGEKVWTDYHGFFPQLANIHPTAFIDYPCWFVGSRNNYTHQLVDFIPSLIYRSELDGKGLPSTAVNIYGKPNRILDSLLEIQVFQQALNRSNLFLENVGCATQVGNWRIRCVRFSELYLVRHMSVFKSFSILKKAFAPLQPEALEASHDAKSLLYLTRSDRRVINQDELTHYLSHKKKATILGDVHRLSYSQKIRAISGYRRILLPPGSDNINGLLFSESQARLVQMISTPTERLLDSPFYSHACLRYMLPFLHRTTFIPKAENQDRDGASHSGVWNVKDVATRL